MKVDESTVLSAASAEYLGALYLKHRNGSGALPADWAAFFDTLDEDDSAAAPGASDDPGGGREAGMDRLVQAYRSRGHLAAQIDPLSSSTPPSQPEPATGAAGLPGYTELVEQDAAAAPGLDEAGMERLRTRLRETYCGPIGVEFEHICDPDLRQWLYGQVESGRNSGGAPAPTEILETLIVAEEFEHFMQRKFPTTKRFGLEGAESMMVLLLGLLAEAAALGVDDVLIAGMHRGRLNILANVMGKPLAAMFAEIRGDFPFPAGYEVAGDVPYHLGYTSTWSCKDNSLRLTLASHPSHLLAIPPVMLGRVRAAQDLRGDGASGHVLGLMLHTDAAFAGQGVMSEIFQLSGLPGYRTGGTVHFVINNQLGFTTNPGDGRSSRYCTDVAKIVEAPIFHVNGDDPEAVWRVAVMAARCRQRFGRDVVVDLVCYRRRGHNELDEPRFTQPAMYARIDGHPTVCQLYEKDLRDRGGVAATAGAEVRARERARLAAAFEDSGSHQPNRLDWLPEYCEQAARPGDSGPPADEDSGVEAPQLRRLGEALAEVPGDLSVDPKIRRFQDERREMAETGGGVNWAFAEALAFATLLTDGVRVRLSGQDTARGAFSQRHLVLVDRRTERRYLPLNGIAGRKADIKVIDGPLSEYAVLGFEYGYSTADPATLVVWEAQFGDFANCAQTIIDQFVVCAEEKWLSLSGLVMLLPHGLEGQGLEHSSARPERFLQLCAKSNIQVANCTTPANYFHLLRRQAHGKVRKPLIVMTPKSLLRSRDATSCFKEMATGTGFQGVLPDPGPGRRARRLVLCSGKIYFDLAKARKDQGLDEVALVRLEQLYPFPVAALGRELARYPDADLVWCQEEPENGGAWGFVDRRLENLLSTMDGRAKRARYVGRPAGPTPSWGPIKDHAKRQAEIVAAALAGI